MGSWFFLELSLFGAPSNSKMLYAPAMGEDREGHLWTALSLHGQGEGPPRGLFKWDREPCCMGD